MLFFDFKNTDRHIVHVFYNREKVSCLYLHAVRYELCSFPFVVITTCTYTNVYTSTYIYVLIQKQLVCVTFSRH
mgnify:CR=1 FL=1